MADYSALATIPLVQGRVFYAPQVNAIILKVNVVNDVMWMFIYFLRAPFFIHFWF